MLTELVSVRPTAHCPHARPNTEARQRPARPKDPTGDGLTGCLDLGVTSMLKPEMKKSEKI